MLSTRRSHAAKVNSKSRLLSLLGLLLLGGASAAVLFRDSYGSDMGSAQSASSSRRPHSVPSSGLSSRSDAPAPARRPDSLPSSGHSSLPTPTRQAEPAGPPTESALSPSARLARSAFIAELFRAPLPSATDSAREAWQEIEPLLYLDGHPCAGLPRDSSSPDQLTDAGMEVVSKMFPAEVLDKPQLHYVGRQDFFWLNHQRRRVDEADLDAVRAFYDTLLANPAPAQSRLVEIWLPAHPDDPDVTTYRELFRGQVATQSQEVFERGPCPL